MKVIVCGSRHWLNFAAVLRELRKLPRGTVIIHGGCKTGADAMADKIARKLGLTVRVYPADWEGEEARTGSAGAAGPKRNTLMIATEHVPDDPVAFVLAFTLDLRKSKGTRDCVTKAEAVQIPVTVLAA